MLTRPIKKGDQPAAHAKERDLGIVFRAYAEPYRTQLATRLLKSAKGDELAELFHGRLHHAVRARLIALLGGDPTPLAETAAAQVPAFAAALDGKAIKVEPDPVVLDSHDLPAQIIQARIDTNVSPPPEVGDVRVDWRLLDATRSEITADEGAWIAGSPVSLGLVHEVDTLGEYALTAHVVADGLVEKVVERKLEVKPSRLDLLRKLGDRDLVDRARELESKLASGQTEGGDVKKEIEEIEWVLSEREKTLDWRPEIKREVEYKVANVANDPAAVHWVARFEYGQPFLSGKAEMRRQLLAKIREKRSIHNVRVAMSDDERYLKEQENKLKNGWPTQMDATSIRIARRAYDEMYAQLAIIEAEENEFKKKFTDELWNMFRATSDAAWQATRDTRDKYGIPKEYKPTITSSILSMRYPHQPSVSYFPYSAQQQEQQEIARKELTVAAAELAEAKATSEAAQAAFTEFIEWNWINTGTPVRLADGRLGQELWAEEQAEQYRQGKYVLLEGEKQEEIAAKFAEYWRLRQPRDAALKRFAKLLAQKERDMPFFAAMRKASAAELQAMSTQAGALTTIKAKVEEVEGNLVEVQSHLRDDPEDIWQLDRLVQMTMAKLKVPAKSRRGELVTDLIEEAEPWVDKFLTVLGIALAVAGMIVTGGTAAIVLELASLAVDAYVVYEHVQDYQFGMAAANSDLDPLRAMASQEPSLFQICLDIAFTALGAYGAVRAFKHGRKLKNVVKMTGGASDEAKQLVKELNELGAPIERKLGDEMLDDALRLESAAPYEVELRNMIRGKPAELIDIKVRVAPDAAAFKAVAGDSELAQAVVKVTVNAEGEIKAVVHVHPNAPPSVIREEAAHLDQIADPKRLDAFRALDEAKLAKWSQLSDAEKLDAVRAKLDLEIDAQKRVIASLKPKPGAVLSEADAIEIDRAWQNIEHLRAQFDEWGQLQVAAGKGPVGAAPLLQKRPYLFGKATTTEFDILELVSLEEKQFVTEYRRLHPSSGLTDLELLERYAVGKRINPESTLLHTPGRVTSKPPDITADPKLKGKYSARTPTPEGHEPIAFKDPADKAEVDRLIKERDDLRAERDRLRDAGKETDAAKVGAQVNERSRLLGHVHSKNYMNVHYPGYERIYPAAAGAKSVVGDFDEVWKGTRKLESGELVEDYIVVEVKGGAGKLGVKVVGRQVVQQGTRQYFDAILKNMEEIAPDIYRQLNAADKNVSYLLVHAPIESGAPSLAERVIVHVFNLTP